MNAATTSDEVRAPGNAAFRRPGRQRRVGPASAALAARRQKDGIGTAVGGSSLVWFTIGRGSLEEVFFPSVDNACAGGLSCSSPTGSTFSAEERHDCKHRVELPVEGSHSTTSSTRVDAGFRIEKTILAHRDQNAILQFVELPLGDAGRLPALRARSTHAWPP